MRHWAIRRGGKFWGFDAGRTFGYHHEEGGRGAIVYHCAVSPAPNMSLGKGEEVVEVDYDRLSRTWWVKREPVPETMSDIRAEHDATMSDTKGASK